MTTEEFIKSAVGFYGTAYRIQQIEPVKKTLNKIPDRYKAVILENLVSTFSTRFRIPPGVCEIIEAYKSVKSEYGRTENRNVKKCQKCGRIIFSDFCPKCDEKADIYQFNKLKEIIND